MLYIVKAHTAMLCLFILLTAPVFAQEEQIPQGEGKGGVKIGPGIIIPFILIPSIIKKLKEGKEQLPAYKTLDKKPINISQSGNNYIIDWVVYYANNTNSVQNGITISDGPINSIIPGSLQQPAGWTGSLNPTNTVATWTGNAPPINGYMSTNVNTTTSISSTFNFGSASGDGFRAIPYRHTSSGNKLRIYIINHHEWPGNVIFKCVDTTTGATCPGFPKALPKGDSTGKTSGSGNFEGYYYYIDNGKLYYPVTASDKEFGLGCYNLETDSECGFYKLGTQPGTSFNMYVMGPIRVGSELYMVGGDKKLYCLNATNPSNPCFGGNYFTGYTFPSSSFTSNSVTGPSIWGRAAGNKIYFITDDSPGFQNNKNVRAFCFDTTAKAGCAGWTVSQVSTSSLTIFAGPPFIYYNIGMVPKHICLRKTNTQLCFDLTTGLQSSPPVIFSSITFTYGIGYEITLGTRTYFADIQPAITITEKVLCWDWATASPCNPTWEYKSWQPDPDNYSVNVDDTGCIWVVGHNASQVWYFDPTKPPDKDRKAQKCHQASKEGKHQHIFQPWQYCSGPKPFIWTGVEIANASLSDFTKLLIKVKDSSNNIIFTYDCVVNNSLNANLASIVSQTNGQPLNVEVEYTLASGSNLNNFELKAYYHASPLEFCYKSQHNCLQDVVKNTVNVSGVEQGPKVEVELPKPQSCPVVGEDGQGSGQPSGPGSGSQGGSGGSSGSGIGSGLGGALLSPVPLPEGGILGAGGALEGAGGTAPLSGVGGSGAQVLEKDGKVHIIPETKQRCYWRPKATAPAKPKEETITKKPVVSKKKPVRKEPITSGTKTAKASVSVKKPIKKPLAPPKAQPAKGADMEYVCEPEK